MSNLSITFLGTRLMGAPMARNLLKAGFNVSAWNRTRSKAEALGGDGALVFDTPQQAVAGADYVITMLSDGPAVHELMINQGVAAAMKKGATILDMGSIKVSEAKSNAKIFSSMGLKQLDSVGCWVFLLRWCSISQQCST